MNQFKKGDTLICIINTHVEHHLALSNDYVAAEDENGGMVRINGDTIWAYYSYRFKLKEPAAPVPERAFPETSLTNDELETAFNCFDPKNASSLKRVANAAIRKHILDTEKSA